MAVGDSLREVGGRKWLRFRVQIVRDGQKIFDGESRIECVFFFGSVDVLGSFGI
jgi:hypothetical protein